VKNAAFAYKRALSLGAWGVENKVGPMELTSRHQGHRRFPDLPGRPLWPKGSIYDVDFEYLPGVDPSPAGVGLTYIDHLTHNVHRGRMAEWAYFYERLFNFRESPLLRHRGQADRAQIQGDDQSVRQDPHPDQREHRRQVADPGISLGLSRRRASSTSRWHVGHLTIRSRPLAHARACRSMTVPDTYYEQVRCPPARPRARTWRGSRPTGS